MNFLVKLDANFSYIVLMVAYVLIISIQNIYLCIILTYIATYLLIFSFSDLKEIHLSNLPLHTSLHAQVILNYFRIKVLRRRSVVSRSLEIKEALMHSINFSLLVCEKLHCIEGLLKIVFEFVMLRRVKVVLEKLT